MRFSKGQVDDPVVMAARARVSSMTAVGPVGRLGAWTADHFRAVLVAWIVVAVGLGVLAPRVETALSGAGWEASGSQSVEARKLIDANFGGQSSAALMVVVHSPSAKVGDAPFTATVDRVAAILRGDGRVASVALPMPGFSISQDGHTAIVSAGAKGSTTVMVAAADDLKSELKAAGAEGVQVSLTGASGMWSDFNEANRSAMMKSELLSWPVTLVILMLAFGSLVAAGLPLMLTILGPRGLCRHALPRYEVLRHLDLGDELRAHVRTRARNRLCALRRPSLPRSILRLEAVSS